MSEIQVPKFPELSAEQLEKIGGGECTVADLRQFTQDLQTSYENLVDFVSHVMDRVTGQ